MNNNSVRWAAGVLIVALLLKLAGVAAFSATLVIVTLFVAGRFIRGANGRVGTILMGIATVLAAVTILIPFATRLTVDGFPPYIGGALHRQSTSVALKLTERIDPGTYAAEAISLQACKDEIERETTRITAEFQVLGQGRTNGTVTANFFDAESRRLNGEIEVLRTYREECSKRFRGRDLTEVASDAASAVGGTVSGAASAVANSAVVTNAQAKATSAWDAIPFFTSKSGLIALLGLVFIVVGSVVFRYHSAFGGGIMAAGVVMLLAGAGDWLSSQNSLFAQLRNGITGDYNQPWYVTVLALTAVGVLIMALFGVETRVRLSTIMVAILLLAIAWIARSDTKLSDVTSNLEAKLGGVNINLPSPAKIFGGTVTVPCSEHDAAFRDADLGQLVRCFQRMKTGDQTMVQLHGGDWGITPSNAPMHITLWYGEKVVYRGVYRPGTHPTANRIQISADGPADLTISVRKRIDKAKL